MEDVKPPPGPRQILWISDGMCNVCGLPLVNSKGKSQHDQDRTLVKYHPACRRLRHRVRKQGVVTA